VGRECGGSNTLNLMFRSPDLFQVGVPSPRSRPDTSTTPSTKERYMGLQDENAAAYHDDSAINFAEGLSGVPLIVHGSGDDNVHWERFNAGPCPFRLPSLRCGPPDTLDSFRRLKRH
jgi:dipeptidyl-peptidase 4